MGRPRKEAVNKYQERLKKMRLKKHLGRKELRDNVRILRDQGWSFKKIAIHLTSRGEKVSCSTVRRQWMWDDKLREKMYTPTSVSKPVHERVRELIRKLYDTNGHRTTAQVAKLIEEEFGIRVSKSVISVWREELGFRVMRVRYGFAVRMINRAIRLAFAIDKLRCNEQFMSHIFSDEMVIQLDKNSKSIWCQSRAAAVLPAPKFPSKILIWGSISWRGASKMVILSGQTGVDSIVYQDILNSALIPFMRNIYGTTGVFVQDSAPAHVSKTTRRYLKNKDITCETWPPESPDANPIELIWAIMKKWIIDEYKPNSLQDLIDGAQFWWKHKCTVDLCRSVISNVPKALKLIVAAHGGPVHN